MKKLLLVFSLLLLSPSAWAQCSGVFSANMVCGVGATAGPPRPINASTWLKGIYFARDYGAKCDGATNDVTAINAAITAANAAGGGTVQIDPGVCVVGVNPVVMKGNVLLRGVGKDATTLKLTAFYTGNIIQAFGNSLAPIVTNAPTASTSKVLNFASTTGVTAGMLVTDNTTPIITSNNNYVVSTTPTTVTLAYAVGAGGVLAGDSISFWTPISNVGVNNLTIDGGQVSFTSYTQATTGATPAGNSTLHFTGLPSFLTTPTPNMLIWDATIFNNTAIPISGVFTSVNTINSTTVTISNPTGAAGVANGDNITFFSFGMNIFFSSALGVQVSDIRITNKYGYGGITIQSSREFSVTDSVFMDGVYDFPVVGPAVLVINSSLGKISDNVVHGGGFELSANEVIVSNNDVTPVAGSGIDIDPSVFSFKNTVIGNHVHDGTLFLNHDGIYGSGLEIWSNDSVIANNVIHNVGDSGLGVGGKNSVVISNVIYDTCVGSTVTCTAGLAVNYTSANPSGNPSNSVISGNQSYNTAGAAGPQPYALFINSNVVGTIIGNNNFGIGSAGTINAIAGTFGNEGIIGKTFDTAGLANTLKVNGNTINNVTGSSGFVVLAVSPGLTSPVFTTSAIWNGTTSGQTTVQATGVASGTITIPAATDTLVGKATTDAFTNKTFDTGATGNVLQIGGTTVNAVTGSGTVTVGALSGTNAWTGVNTFSNSTAATSASTGAVQVSVGGVGVAGAIWAGTYINATPTVVNSLPTCNAGLDGARAFVTNNNTATAFAGAVTTGGTNHHPVYCDGGASAWKQG